MEQELEIILEDSEWYPKESINSSKWKKKNGYYVHLSPPKIKYRITTELIEIMDKYNGIYKLLKKGYVPPINQTEIAKIFKMYDGSDTVLYGYTTMSILRYIKSNLQRYLRGIDTPFNEFKNIKDIRVELLMVLHSTNKTILEQIKQDYKMNHVTQNIEKYIKIYHKIIKVYELPTNVAYIYKITNTTNEKIYIGASNEKIVKDNMIDIIKYVKSKHKNMKKTDKYEIDYLVKISYSSKIGLHIMIDKYINKYNSISEGYNISFRYIHKLSRNIEQQMKKDIENEISLSYDK